MSNDVMITVSLTLKPEAVEPFYMGLNDSLKETAAFPGFRRIEVVRHKSDATRLLLIERWESEDAYQAYLAWRTARGDYDAVDQIVASISTEVWPTLLASA